MFYIAYKHSVGGYHIEDAVKDWHEAVDGFEPIDCVNGEIAIF